MYFKDSDSYIHYSHRSSFSRHAKNLLDYLSQHEDNISDAQLDILYKEYMENTVKVCQDALFSSSDKSAMKISSKIREQEELIQCAFSFLLKKSEKHSLSARMYEDAEKIKAYKLIYAKINLLDMYFESDLEAPYIKNSFIHSYNDIEYLFSALNTPLKLLVDYVSFHAIKNGHLSILEFLIEDKKQHELLFSERKDFLKTYTRWAITDAVYFNKHYIFDYLYQQNPGFVKTNSCGIQIEDTFLSFNHKKGWHKFNDVSNFIHEDIAKYYLDKKLGQEQKKLFNGHFLELAEAYHYISKPKDKISDLELIGMLYINNDTDFFNQHSDFLASFTKAGIVIDKKQQQKIIEFRINRGMELNCLEKEWTLSDDRKKVHKIIFDNMYIYPDAPACNIVKQYQDTFKQHFSQYEDLDFNSLIPGFAFYNILTESNNSLIRSLDSIAKLTNTIINNTIDFSDWIEQTFDRKLDKFFFTHMAENLYKTIQEQYKDKIDNRDLSPVGEKFLLDNQLLLSEWNKEITVQPKKINRI